MSTEKKSFNQSAFPINKQIQMCEQGMTLRDHFAGLAMQAMIANPTIANPWDEESAFALFSKQAFRYADAMLKQREL